LAAVTRMHRKGDPSFWRTTNRRRQTDAKNLTPTIWRRLIDA
jgi:hypothetical protein